MFNRTFAKNYPLLIRTSLRKQHQYLLQARCCTGSSRSDENTLP